MSIQLFAALWTIVHQASLSVGILQARILQWVAIPFSNYHMTQQFYSKIYIKTIENKDANRYLYTHVHISAVHDSQKVETAQMSING